jgi:hypothetical protein
MVRNRDLSRDAMNVYECMLRLQRDGVARITLAAFKRDLAIGSDQLSRALAELGRVRLVVKERTRRWAATLRRWVQDVNAYMLQPLLPASESRRGATSIQEQKKEAREERARGVLRFWKPRLAPHPPIRTVEEQLALLRGG